MLSIIIISKNEEKCIERLLKSIKMQDFKDYEIILSDAQSTDKTRKIARKYGCRIVEGGLPSKGRNAGAKASKGNLLLFLDSDVVLPKHFLKKNIEEFKGYSCATAIYKPMSNKRIDKILYGSYNYFARSTQKIFSLAGGFCIFCTKDVYKKIGGFDENMMMCEDHFFVNQARKYGKFGILKSVPILCDVRRMDKEGRFGLCKKYFVVSIHLLFKGWIFDSSPVKYELQGNVQIKTLKKRHINFLRKITWICIRKVYVPLKRYKIKSKGRFQKRCGFLVASHHEEWDDPPIICMASNRELNWIATTKRFGRFMNLICRWIGIISIEDSGLFDYTAYLLHEGEGVVIFPEGCIKSQRNDKKFGDFKDGVIRLRNYAEQKYGIKVPIYPLGLDYSNKDVRLKIGKPIFPKKIKDVEMAIRCLS